MVESTNFELLLLSSTCSCYLLRLPYLFSKQHIFYTTFNQFDNWSYWLFFLIHFSLPKETNTLENQMYCKSYIKARDHTNMSQIFYTFFGILVFLVLSWSCIVKLNACKHGYKVRTATLELLLEVIVLLKGTCWVAQNLLKYTDLNQGHLVNNSVEKKIAAEW